MVSLCELHVSCCWEDWMRITQMLKGKAAVMERRKYRTTEVLEVWVTVSEKIRWEQREKGIKNNYYSKRHIQLACERSKKERVLSWVWILSKETVSCSLSLTVLRGAKFHVHLFVCNKTASKKYCFFLLISFLLEEATLWLLAVGDSCCKSLSSLAVWVSVCLTTDTQKMRIQMLFSAYIIHWFWGSNHLHAENLECFLLGHFLYARLAHMHRADGATTGICKVWICSFLCYWPAQTTLSF